MKQCPECSTENNATTKFCGECGTKLPNDQPKAANYSPSIGNDAMVSGDISMIGKQETVHAQSYVIHNYQDSKAAPHGECVLKIIADLSCKVYVDGEYHCDSEEGKVTRLPLRRGVYLLEFISIDNSKDTFSREYKLSELEELLKVPLKEKQQEREDKEDREGVLINGVRWATRNVDAPGTFAKKNEDAGMIYQWNRKKAWNTTDKKVSDWDSTSEKDTTWERANDPSPKGWRVPTKEEIEKLCDETKVRNEWIERNGVCGRKFSDLSNGNSIFLPAAGFRDGFGGSLHDVGECGRYRSSAQRGRDSAQVLGFGNGGVDVHWANRNHGFSVRCVADNY